MIRLTPGQLETIAKAKAAAKTVEPCRIHQCPVCRQLRGLR